MMNALKSANASKWMRTALLAALATATAGCHNNEMPEAGKNPEKQNEKMTIHVATGEKKAGTRVAYDDDKVGNAQGNALTWQMGDKLTVVRMNAGSYADYKDDYLYKGEDGATSGSFEGTEITDEGDSWTVYYPNTVTVNADGTATLPMTGQAQEADNSTAHLRNYMLLEATGLANLIDQLNLEMKSSIMKFELSGISAEVGTLKALTWEVETASGTTRELTLTFPAAGADGAVVFGKDGKADLTAYLSFLPQEMEVKAGGKFTVTLIGDKAYAATMTASASGKTYEAGKRYTATIDNTAGTVEWEETFIVNTTVPSGAAYNYNGLEMQIGTWQAGGSAIQTTLATTTIVGGKAVFHLPSALSADTKIWVCIPRVVKFFHTLAADETAVLTLPDKDGGSTLKDSPAIDGKKYENDWIVALYMGVNKDGATDPDATPIYWATGNLIATRTSMAGNGYAFHIATAEQTISEATTNNYSPDGITGDVYGTYSLGLQWDKFGWGDHTGLIKSTNNRDYIPDMKSDGESICGTEHDIAHVQLGGSWRLPTGGSDANHEFAAFGDNTDLPHLLPDGIKYELAGKHIGYKYTYTQSDAGSTGNIITNTLSFPAAGWRIAGGSPYDRGTNSHYWSGIVRGYDSAYTLRLFKADHSSSYHSRFYGCQVRPVSE